MSDREQAIHAATNALRDIGVPGGDPAKREARVAVEAAWPHMAGMQERIEILLRHHHKDMEQLQTAQQENERLHTFEQAIRDALWHCYNAPKNTQDDTIQEVIDAMAILDRAALGQVDQP